MNQSRLEIEDLAAVIRESIATHQNENTPIRASQTVSPENSFPQIKLQPDFQPHSDHRYHVNDLLRYHDRAFVQAAYRALLKRSPDATELARDLTRLRSGNVNKIDLLATLRFTPEGRAKGVQVNGLVVPAMIRRLGQLPLVGYVIRLGIAFVRLPNLVRDQREFGSYVLSQHEQMAEFINQVSARVSECRHELSQVRETLANEIGPQVVTLADRLSNLEKLASTQFSEIDLRYDRLDAFTKQRANELLSQLATDKQDVLARFDESNTKLQSALDQSIAQQRETLSRVTEDLRTEIDRLHSQLQHARSELSIQANTIDARLHPLAQIPADTSGDSHQLDALYAALEDRFRGTRDEIKERFEVYLPYVKDLAPVVDLGCGRGEWLEILGAAGIEARGVDTNLIQLEQCRARGLNVSEEDFLAHLQTLDEASAGAITGFHIVEHVPLKTLVTLLNEALRVLRPGGIVIFETPNPENVLVGSNYFYMDPTHRNPLPSELLEFLLESRGFKGIEILKLHPWESARIAEDNEVTERFNAYFYGPMDYAIVGRKIGA
ncbi:MAG TPA: methyltransferase domain-containing protein [Pyrinomonadaceae bacterium]|nr:methyltransferase domain-containing protein [Pyrinomonadaceae bacterium]